MITVITNSVVPDVRLGSVAVTLTAFEATSLFSGVPLKVRVPALNVSHDGNAEPSTSVAAYDSGSPSTSLNVSAAKAKENGASSVAL